MFMYLPGKKGRPEILKLARIKRGQECINPDIVTIRNLHKNNQFLGFLVFIENNETLLTTSLAQSRALGFGSRVRFPPRPL